MGPVEGEAEPDVMRGLPGRQKATRHRTLASIHSLCPYSSVLRLHTEDEDAQPWLARGSEVKERQTHEYLCPCDFIYTSESFVQKGRTLV